MKSMAITDFTNMYGIIKFYNKSHFYGIKPIIGVDFKMQWNLLGIKNSKITILAMNIIGYKNLINITSLAYQNGYNINDGPKINFKHLIKYNKGLIILSGGCYGDIGQSILTNNNFSLEYFINFYKKYFNNKFYLEIMRTGRDNEEIYIDSVLKLSFNKKIPLVATNEVCFLNKSDFYIHEVRVAIYNKYNLNNYYPKKYSKQQYMRSSEEMCSIFSDIPSAIQNTLEISKRCNVILDLNKCFLPKFPVTKLNEKNVLIMKSKNGLENRLLNKKNLIKNKIKKTKKYKERLLKELNIINKSGFSGYFLIVMEFIKWAKKNKIPVGPGRGSGAGSLVAYSLNITDLDPIEFNLLFERFLNLERISMPDFDIDFCMNKRDKVIEHVIKLYGRYKVAQIITFGTMTAKAVIRDVGRVLGNPYKFVDKIAKLVPTNQGINLKQAFKKSPQLSKIYKYDNNARILINIAIKLEGLTRNIGKHAGGVVISPSKITDFVPLYCDYNGDNLITQFDKYDIEKIGLIKFDFLGLRTLTVINSTINIINNKYNNSNINVNINKISLCDKKVFLKLREANTTSIFQLESYGMKELIFKLKPDCFEDIIALISLFRPGPLKSGMVNNFINRKHGKEDIYYPDVKCHYMGLKKILKPTYGIILYQEQVMEVAKEIANYNLGDADILCRAMSKKNKSEMKKQRNIFQSRAIKKGINKNIAIKIFNLISNFAEYGFNKSHSTAYALLSYQTMWLKTYYPSEFMLSVINSDIDNINKVVKLIYECRNMNLKIIPPNINYSTYKFSINNKGNIIYGMGAIKGIQKKLIIKIISSRVKFGKFINLYDLCLKSNIKKMHTKMIEKIIKSGSLDLFNFKREVLINLLPSTIKYAEQYRYNRNIGQLQLFKKDNIDIIQTNEILKNNIKDIEYWNNDIKLKKEKESLGFYITDHPINKYKNTIKKYIGYSLKEILNYRYIKEKVIVIGMILFLKFINTKKKKKICICVLNDKHNQIEVVLFSNLVNKYNDILLKNNIIIVKGIIQYDIFKNINKIIAYNLININNFKKYKLFSLNLYFMKYHINNIFIIKIYKLLNLCSYGLIKVNLFYKKNKKIVKLLYNNFIYINYDFNFINKIRLLFGLNKIKFNFILKKNN